MIIYVKNVTVIMFRISIHNIYECQDEASFPNEIEMFLTASVRLVNDLHNGIAKFVEYNLIILVDA